MTTMADDEQDPDYEISQTQPLDYPSDDEKEEPSSTLSVSDTDVEVSESDDDDPDNMVDEKKTTLYRDSAQGVRNKEVKGDFKAMAKTGRLRRNVFTLNNYTEADIKNITTWALPAHGEDELANFICFGKEKAPTTGTPHLQGYVEWLKPMRFKRLHKLLPGAWWARAKGTAWDNMDYCGKDGDYVELGEPKCHPTKSKRTDIMHMRDDIVAGMSTYDIMMKHDAAWRLHRAADKFSHLHAGQELQRFTPVEVCVYVGEAGTGKTRTAVANAHTDYGESPYMVSMPSTKKDKLWFDNYHGQKAIILDDFYGQIDYSYMLRLLDGYAFQVQVKGGMAWKRWQRVYITSNCLPKMWYGGLLSPALARRLTVVKEFNYDLDDKKKVVVQRMPGFPRDGHWKVDDFKCFKEDRHYVGLETPKTQRIQAEPYDRAAPVSPEVIDLTSPDRLDRTDLRSPQVIPETPQPVISDKQESEIQLSVNKFNELDLDELDRQEIMYNRKKKVVRSLQFY